MHRLGIVLLTVFMTTAIAGATKYPFTAKDSRGKAITLPREPRRIVSLAPNTTEILFALGLDSRIAGVTNYCNYPAAARKKEKVGDARTSVEKVIALRPDLVLAHGYLNDQAIRSLEAHELKVFAIDPRTIAETARDIGLVGRITNREKEASKVSARILSARALVGRKTARLKSKPKVLVVAQADPLWVAGPKTYVDEMIRIAGGENVAHDAKPGFNQFSAETAVARDPDVIVGTTRGDKKVFTRGYWKHTKASHAGRVYEMDPDLLFRPGPRLADGILTIARLIHPDVFRKP